MRVIHVNRQFIAMNNKDGGQRPEIIVRESVKSSAKTTYASKVEILGPSTIVTGGKLPCGAKVWIETDAELKITDPMTFKEAKTFRA